MSIATHEFHGIRCDFPECGELYDGGEYSYYYDVGEAREHARDDEWLTGFEDKDYCPSHVVPIYNDPDAPDDDEWDWLRPLEDTFENRLKVAMDRVLRKTNRRLDQLERDLLYRIGDRHSGLYGRTDRALHQIHERACRAIKPDLTGQEMFNLKNGGKRAA